MGGSLVLPAIYLVLIPEIPPPFLLSEFTRCICIKTTKKEIILTGASLELMQSYQIRLCTKNQDHCHVSEGEMIRKPKSGLSEARKFGSTLSFFSRSSVMFLINFAQAFHCSYFLTHALCPIKEAKKINNI